jgi:K+-transporting ATPase ATPase B chain
VREAIKQSFAKLSPRYMVRNPVMFTVEIGTAVMMAVCVWVAMGETSHGSLAYNIAITAILFFTVLFANFAEAIAEARGKARQNSCVKQEKKHRLKNFL